MTRLARQVVRAAEAEAPVARLFVLHGFLGAGRNWASFARRLVDLRPEWEACLVDLRLHGESLDASSPHSLEASADDVASLESGPHRTVALLGHSFGGKVALAALGRMDPGPVQAWVIDSTPSRMSAGGSASRMLERLEASPPSFPDREAGIRWIVDGGFDEPTARWMATNLERSRGAFRWRLDASALRELLDDFLSTDAWSVLEDPPRGTEIHFVRAASGSILSSADTERLQRLAARGEPVELHELDGGHWLHIDNPDGLLELLSRRLPRPSSTGF